jgi:hypothetical protein
MDRAGVQTVLSLPRSQINNAIPPYEIKEKSPLLCQIILIFFLPYINLAQPRLFYNIWGEIGNELGRKNITKNNLNEM